MKPLYHLTFIGGNMPTNNKALFNSAAALLHTYEVLRAAGGPLPIISRGDVVVTIPDLKTEAWKEQTCVEVIDDSAYLPLPVENIKKELAVVSREIVALEKLHYFQRAFTTEQADKWRALLAKEAELTLLINKEQAA